MKVKCNLCVCVLLGVFISRPIVKFVTPQVFQNMPHVDSQRVKLLGTQWGLYI